MIAKLILAASMIFPGTIVNLEEPENPISDEGPIVISMGDSYSSGEGVEPFYDQDLPLNQKVESADWIAHRSEKSWPGKLKVNGLEEPLASYKDKNWRFVAASGATTEELSNDYYHYYCLKNSPLSLGLTGTNTLPPQLSAFIGLKPDSVDYVTITIGGNDAHFSDIITMAVTEIDYLNPYKLDKMFRNTWHEFEYGKNGKAPIKNKLKDAYRNILERAGSKADVIVAGYPTLINDEGAIVKLSKTGVNVETSQESPIINISLETKRIAIGFDKAEADMINTNVCKFNKCIQEIVENIRKDGSRIHFVSVEEVFKDHEAYTAEPYINSVVLKLPENASTQDINVGFMDVKEDGSVGINNPVVSAYSIHPNEVGTDKYAECIQKEISRIEKEKKSQTREVTEKEAKQKVLKSTAFPITPDQVVINFCNAVKDGKYRDAARCLDPESERMVNFVGSIADGLFGSEIECSEAIRSFVAHTGVEVIECSSNNSGSASSLDLVNEFFPNSTIEKDLFGKEALVHVAYRWPEGEKMYVSEMDVLVRRYGVLKWRIPLDQISF